MESEARADGSEPKRSMDAVLAEFLELIEQGDREKQEALIARHLRFADELRDFRSNHDHVNALARNLREQDPGGPLPRCFGPFVLIRPIGKGGMGVVYRAWHTKLQRPVALKMIRGGPTSNMDVSRFLKEAQAVSDLDHPNIVRVHDYGDIDGQPYFTMNLVEGPSLEERIPYYKQRPRETARLLATITRAVRHAHQRAILHRDLKPANVLLDKEMNPHVTDFGLALRVDRESRLTAEGAIIGTLNYMAPEQARGERLLTLRTDVYALGAILYELLTGQPPVPAGPPLEMLEKIENMDPPAPFLVNPKSDRDLSTISMKCLEKDPLKRYENAAALADDLENWLDERPIVARPAGRAERAWRWCRRNTLKAVLAAMVALLALTLAGATVSYLAQEAGRRAERLKVNSEMAEHVAHQVLLRIRGWARRVDRVSRDSDLRTLLTRWNEIAAGTADGRAVRDLLRKEEARRLQSFLARLPADPNLENWQLLDARGYMVARIPRHDIVGTDFRKRDYFQGTLGHRSEGELRNIHISKVYRSIADGLYKYDICAPVRDGEGNPIGVIAVSATTHPDMGLPHLQLRTRKATLVAPGDSSEPRRDSLPEFLILLHPEMKRGDDAVPFDPKLFPGSYPRRCGREVESSSLRRLDATSTYVDPFGARDPDYKGTWFAGFAPVGHTGFMVVIQERDE